MRGGSQRKHQVCARELAKHCPQAWIRTATVQPGKESRTETDMITAAVQTAAALLHSVPLTWRRKTRFSILDALSSVRPPTPTVGATAVFQAKRTVRRKGICVKRSTELGLTSPLSLLVGLLAKVCLLGSRFLGVDYPTEMGSADECTVNLEDAIVCSTARIPGSVS